MKMKRTRKTILSESDCGEVQSKMMMKKLSSLVKPKKSGNKNSIENQRALSNCLKKPSYRKLKKNVLITANLNLMHLLSLIHH